MGRHGFPIYHRELRIPWEKAKFRSFYVPKGEGPHIKECAIYYAKGMSPRHIRYYKTKELLQIHLWQEALATHDVVDLVRNMILRESPAAADLDLGHSTASDTLGEIAAMEFLFPIRDRIAFLNGGGNADSLDQLVGKYNVPPFLIGRALRVTESLIPFFCPEEGTPDETKK